MEPREDKIQTGGSKEQNTGREDKTAFHQAGATQALPFQCAHATGRLRAPIPENGIRTLCQLVAGLGSKIGLPDACPYRPGPNASLYFTSARTSW